MSLEELMNLEITSASKKPQKRSAASAAVFVITQDDIRRSGVTSIPEALRMVPGLQVARIDANKWAISSRGFNERFANKLLVLMDGRTVYTPLFSGVYWDVQDTLLEDIERIEVIRGPGAALWGANAVNGVINIITKNAKDTQGGLLSTHVSTEENLSGGFRFGGKIDETTFYRVYTKYSNWDRFVNSSGWDAADEWDVARGGFRVDSELSESDTLTVQGDLYSGEVGTSYKHPYFEYPYAQVVNIDDTITGANLLSRWKREFSSTSNIALQLYYDWSKRALDIGGENRDIFDLDFQHHFAWGDRNDVVWGWGYRFTADHIDDTIVARLDPRSREDHLFNLFVQDDLMLWEDRLHLILGSKFEHNDYTGFEIQPNVRLLWTPHERHSLWTSVSRAVRTPSRAEHDLHLVPEVALPFDPRLPLPYPVFSEFIGNREYESENLLAYEIGYRWLVNDRFNIDVATFYNKYDRLHTAELGMLTLIPDPPPIHFSIPGSLFNKMDGETYGVEFVADWRLLPSWKLQFAYTYLQMQLHLAEDSTDVVFEQAEGESPHHQFSLRTAVDLVKNLELDIWLRHTDNLPAYAVPAYTTLDVRLGWKPHDNFELALGVQNAFDPRHREFGNTRIIRSLASEVERNIYLQATWRF